MNVDDINQKVQTAVGLAWPAFAADHPALAAVLDQEVVSEHVTDSLTSDPSFQKAYAAAVIAGDRSRGWRGADSRTRGARHGADGIASHRQRAG